MNKIAFKQSEDGTEVNIKQQQSQQNDLFGTQGTLKFNSFAEKLQEELKNKKTMSNKEIVEFTIMEGFLPKHAKDVLKKILKIVVKDEDNNDITAKPAKWNIAEKLKKNILFTYDN